MAASALSRQVREDTEEYLLLLEETARRESQRLFYRIYPEQDEEWLGPTILKNLIQHGQTLYSRHRYAKHMEFFAVGLTHRERCAMMANRVGKTLGLGGYEMACHLTGLYPEWWEGRRFDQAVSAWAAGKNNETTRDIVQATLLGQKMSIGSRRTVDGCGIIPGDLLTPPTWKQGVQDMIDTIRVRHTSGYYSELSFKSYEQGRDSFEGTGKHIIWLDEEPPAAVYEECLIRTATTGGIIILTFTPLEGMSEVVMQFMPADQRPSST